MRVTRRKFVAGAGALAAMPALAMRTAPVELGLQTYTFHNVRTGGPVAIDLMIAGMRQLKINLCELWAPQSEPFPMATAYWAGWRSAGEAAPVALSAEQRGAQREAVRAWRTNPPAGYFADIRRRFQREGIRVFAYNYSFEPTMTDAEIEHGFLAAKELGVPLITASTRPSVAQRVVPFAEKHAMTVAFHNHANLKDPDDIATPESFAKVLAMSPRYCINLDVGHFASAGFDSVQFLREHHATVTNLHIHDRLANDGKSVPYGQGVAPVTQVLKLLREERWNIPCFYELEYVGADGRDVIAETRRELDYEIAALRQK